VGAGFSTVTPLGGSVNVTSVAQAVWSYTPRSLTDIQSLVTAIQNNDPSAVPSYSDLQYVPVPYFAGQVTADQVAAFIDNAIRNYNLLNPFIGFINNNPYNLWTPNAVGAFLSSQNMSQTSVALLLANVGTTQMAQALNNLSGNYANVANAFNMVSPATAATVMANISASQAATILSNPVMSVTQATLILNDSNMSVTQAAMILSNANMSVTQAAMIFTNNNMSITQAAQILSNTNMSVTQAASIVSIAVNYNATQVAQELSLVSTSQLVNIALNPNMPPTSLFQIISNVGMSANNAQLILYQLAQNYYYNKWINIVTMNAGATTMATNVSVVNPLYSQNLTVASGVTVTCGTSTCYFIAQQFNNYGVIVNGNGAINAAGPGTGGGGIVIIAGTNNLGSIVVAGGTGGPARSTYIGGAGVLYVVGTNVTIGMGGTGAYNSSAAYQGAGGAPLGVPGGSGGATGGPVVLYSFSSNNSMLTYILQGLSDWWLLYVLQKSPASTTPLPYMYGAGGGGGQNANGGGEGGEVIAYGYVVVGGNINAQGGGSDGSYGATGSGGGGGGVVYVFYGLTAGSVSINVAGGNGGNASYPGGTGGTGIAVIAAVTVNG